jgi:hypothetical protein
MNKSKIRGTAAESAVVDLLRSTFWPHAERRALQGGKDMGDTTGHPGLVFEVKDCKVWSIPAWLRETDQERINARADIGVLAIKMPGIGYPNADRWVGVLNYHSFAQLTGYSHEAVWQDRERGSQTAVMAAMRVRAKRPDHYRYDKFWSTGHRHNPDGWYAVKPLGPLLYDLYGKGYGTPTDNLASPIQLARALG